jgi:hypothetical protein
MPRTTVTLDWLKGQLEEKYAPAPFRLSDGRAFALTLPLRLSKEQRAEMKTVVKTNNDGAAAEKAAQEKFDAENKRREAAGEPVVVRSTEEQEALEEQGLLRTLTYLTSIVRLAADDRDAANDFLIELDTATSGNFSDQVLMLTEAVGVWMKDAQVGEASPSAS